MKLLDFGLARAGDADDQHLTQSGTIVGTPAYMAPEQARSEKIDARADLFSLGVVLYRLCTGRLPFRGENTMSILTSLAVDTPAPPREINPEIPPRLATLIERLLAKDRTHGRRRRAPWRMNWRPSNARKRRRRNHRQRPRSWMKQQLRVRRQLRPRHPLNLSRYRRLRPRQSAGGG